MREKTQQVIEELVRTLWVEAGGTLDDLPGVKPDEFGWSGTASYRIVRQDGASTIVPRKLIVDNARHQIRAVLEDLMAEPSPRDRAAVAAHGDGGDRLEPAMGTYRLEIRARPDERLLHRCRVQASDDAEAKRRADELWREFVASYDEHEDVTLDRYVLYEGFRVVHECGERSHQGRA